MGVGPQIFHKEWNAIVRVSFFLKNRSVVLITTMSGCDRELDVHFLLCWFTLVSRCTHFTYTNPVTLYYSENMCTNQEATTTSDTQAVNACTCARISQPTTIL